MKTGKINFGKIFNLPANENSLIALSPAGKAKSNLPNKVEGVAVNEDASSLVPLHALAAPDSNQKGYFNIPDTFDAADLLGWYKVAYEDGVKEIIPIQYGVNILGYNPGGEKSLDKREGDAGEPQRTYCYGAGAVNCSAEPAINTPTFFALEWVNKRFGKVVKEVNLYDGINYQATQQNYLIPETKLAESNAILLAGISKVKKEKQEFH